MTIRHKTIGFALVLGALASIGPASGLFAQGVANHDSDAPVSYAANRIELLDRQNRVILSGAVDITQAGLRMQAARTTVAYRNTGNLQIDRIDATGGVTVAKGNETARGDVAIYDFNRRIITMVGNVSLRRGTDTLNGGRLVIDLATGRSVIDGRASGGGSSSNPAINTSGNGRVSGSFSVPKREGN